VDEEAIKDPKRREQFVSRSRAVKLLLQQATRSRILSETGISGRRAIHWVKRCLTPHPDGRIYGFRGVIPMTRLTPYRRRANVKFTPGASHSGAAGAFMQLLRAFPKLDQLIHDQVLNLTKGKLYETKIPIKALHKRLIRLCRELNLDVGMQYPFNTDDMAYVSLSKYVKRIVKENAARAAAARHGWALQKNCKPETDRQDP